MPGWLPTVTGLEEQRFGNYHAYDISGSLTPPSGVLNDPRLFSLRSKLLLPRGLDYVHGYMSGTHYAPFMLNSYYKPPGERTGDDHFTETIDQKIARAEGFYPAEPTLRSLHLRACGQAVPDSNDELQSMSVGYNRGIAQQIPHTLNPHQAFARLFDRGNLDAYSTGEKKSIVDAVLGDLKALRRTRISANDQRRVSAHVDFIRDLERRLNGMIVKKCTSPAAPAITSKDLYEAEDLPALIDAHQRIIVAAFSCDLTAVATLMMESGDHVLPFTGVASTSHHGVSHGGSVDWENEKITIDQWYAKKFGQLLGLLDQVVDDESTGDTLLDNTVAMWGSEFSDGRIHSRYGLPVLLAGGKGRLDTGKLIAFDHTGAEDGYGKIGRPYNELLITLMVAVGLHPQNWEINRQPGVGYYGANLHGRIYETGSRREPCPGLII